MNVYVLWCRSGRRYFVRSSYSFEAVNKIEQGFNEVVSSWDIALSIPQNAVIF